jgi:monovalent cation/hydrogen antiporter
VLYAAAVADATTGHISLAHRGPLGRLVLTGAAVVAAVIVLRLAWMEGSGWFARLERCRRRREALGAHGWRERLVLGWAGMRGAITLAALLAVPVRTNAGHPLTGRDEIIYLGFAVIIVTLVGQGMTLPILVRWLRISEHPSVAEAERQARLELTRAVLDQIGQACDAGQLPEEVADGLRAQYLARLPWLETMTGDEDLEEARLSRA